MRRKLCDSNTEMTKQQAGSVQKQTNSGTQSNKDIFKKKNSSKQSAYR